MRRLWQVTRLIWAADGWAMWRGAAAALAVLAMGAALLGLSGWFITASGLAGLAGIGVGFDFFRPSAGVRGLALGRAGAVHRYDPAGRLLAVIEVPTSNPTSLTFGGEDRGDLYITTSWYDLGPEDRLSQEMAGAIYRCRPGVTGPASQRWRPPVDES